MSERPVGPASASARGARKPGGVGFAALLTVAYTVVAALYLRPIWRVIGERIAPNQGDPIFNLWVLRWSARQIRLGLPDLWNANIFFPSQGTLALSDHLLGLAAIQAVVEALTGNPILGYNLLFFFSFVLTAGATAYVVRASGGSRFAAGVAGALFAFCPFRFGQLNHLQILWMPVLPLTLWTWDRLLAERRPGRALAFLACYLVQVSGGSYLAYMIHVPLLALALQRWRVHGSELLTRRALGLLLPTGAVMLALALPFFLPYLRLGRSLGLERQAHEVVENAAVVTSYLTPTHNSLWFRPGWRPWWRGLIGARGPLKRGEDILFPGVITLVFAAIGLTTAGENRSRAAPLSPGRWTAIVSLATITVAAWLAGDLLTLASSARSSPLVVPTWLWALLLLLALSALGAAWWLRQRAPTIAPAAANRVEPWLRGVALAGLLCFALSFAIVFVPALAVVPGFSGIRVPARFAVFVSLALVIFAARGIDRVAALTPPRARPVLALVLVAVVILELAPRPPHWVRLEQPRQFPQVYRWLAAQSDIGALLELPIRPNNSEAEYMYYSTLHWQPIANGFSGVLPASHRRLTAAVRHLPDAAALDLARSLGITHLVIHFQKLPARITPAEIARWQTEALGDRLIEVHRAGTSRVYRLVSPS